MFSNLMDHLKNLDGAIAWQTTQMILIISGVIGIICFISTMPLLAIIGLVPLAVSSWLLLYKLQKSFVERGWFIGKTPQA